MNSFNQAGRRTCDMKSVTHRRWLGVLLVVAFPGLLRGEATVHAKAQAPADHALLKHTRGGAFFVSEALTEKYHMILSLVQTLEVELDAGRLSGAEALSELDALQEQLKDLREQIEVQKVLVTAVNVHRRSETTTFDLGPERLLIITADSVHVEGWDGAQVKCVLEKNVLASDEAAAAEQLKGIRLQHAHGLAPSIVGTPQVQRDAEEQDFLSSPEGQALSPQQRASRETLLRQIADRYANYAPFQGKPVDTIEIDGLTYEQGNRSMVVEFTSPGGASTSSGVWQRDAALTVYVPACSVVALRGCLVDLDVQGLRAALIVTDDGSRDRDYDGQARIRELHGSLTVENVPVDVVADIHGDVSVRSTVEYVNSGVNHNRGVVACYTAPPNEVACERIDGDLTAWFSRVTLSVGAIKGRIDIVNEFGDTTLAAAPGTADAAQRVISESGAIAIRMTQADLERLPLQALTSCGTIRIEGPHSPLQETSFTLGDDPARRSRNWRGMVSPGLQRDGQMSPFGRVIDALEGNPRPPGLDLISRCGAVRIQCQ